MPPDQLLLDALRDLRGAVDGLRGEQSKLKDELHAAVLDHTVRIGHMETKVALQDQKQIQQEQGLRGFKLELRKDARRWGAIGGAGTGFVAVLGVILKAILGK